MSQDFVYFISCIWFDEIYCFVDQICVMMNFVNLVCGEQWQDNLCNVVMMIDNCFNVLVDWDNLIGDCYLVELQIILVEMWIGDDVVFLLIEILQLIVLDCKIGSRIVGIVGNNFLFYVWDYDFSIVLLQYNVGQGGFIVFEGFGDLYGNLFKCFLNLVVFCENFYKLLVICFSVFSSWIYQWIDNCYLVLGVEYWQDVFFLIDCYFEKMGLWVCYFMFKGSVVFLVFYVLGDLFNDYLVLELIGMIVMMEMFQWIYCFEIYNVNFVVGVVYWFSLMYQDYLLMCIIYDCEECGWLVVQQGKFVQDYFIIFYCDILDRWFV